MSKTTDLASYNPDYYRLLNTVIDEERTIEITMASGKAHHLRQDFYRWRKVLKREGDDENHRRAGAIVVQITPDRGVDREADVLLRFTRHDQTEIGKLLSEALDDLDIEVDL